MRIYRNRSNGGRINHSVIVRCFPLRFYPVGFVAADGFKTFVHLFVTIRSSHETDTQRVPLPRMHVSLWSGDWNSGAVPPLAGAHQAGTPGAFSALAARGNSRLQPPVAPRAHSFARAFFTAVF